MMNLRLCSLISLVNSIKNANFLFRKVKASSTVTLWSWGFWRWYITMCRESSILFPLQWKTDGRVIFWPITRKRKPLCRCNALKTRMCAAFRWKITKRYVQAFKRWNVFFLQNRMLVTLDRSSGSCLSLPPLQRRGTNNYLKGILPWFIECLKPSWLRI